MAKAVSSNYTPRAKMSREERESKRKRVLSAPVSNTSNVGGQSRGQGGMGGQNVGPQGGNNSMVDM